MTTQDKPVVMFVDDDPMLLASTRRQLMMKISDCELVFCNGGQDALDKAAQSPPAIIFSDVRMPEIDGPELLTRIADLYPEAIRFAWTGQTEESQVEKVNAIAHKVFTKPCNTETICDTIADYLSG